MNAKGRLSGRPSENAAAAKPPSPTAQHTAVDDAPVLFDRSLSPSEYVRGPGPRPTTTGPQDATAAPWWWTEAERTVLALLDSGHQVTADDLHEKFADEPSASGAAYGAVFARLAHAGRIREVGTVRSRRPEARRRRLVLWGAP